ncbi:hypothetical protein CVT24_009819 [Panaeolus cyanescens]|uniref:Uncharacterized protein n=1 Tax=Panaeolus cyanescens TaxID=181874 RepID=A0A409X108_9AGAR|nr:hypothetical protein CVT24_009819 [Panaeolus cyanescens]
MCILVSSLPPGSQIAVRDVAEAYRTVPLHPSQWPAAVVRITEELFVVDTCAAFGAGPSGGVFGSIADAGCDLFRASGMGPVSKWVDDHFFIRVLVSELGNYNQLRSSWARKVPTSGPRKHGGRIWYGEGNLADGAAFELFEDCSFPLRDLSGSSPRSDDDRLFCYNMDDVNRLSDELGIPWKLSKDVPFGYAAQYFGLQWDLQERTVSLPPEKATRYQEAITLWKARSRHVLTEIQELYGKLLHASLVIPAGRARLTGLETALSLAHRSPFLPRFPPRSVAADLEWWRVQLSSSSICRSVIIPFELCDLRAFCDASTSTGIGITVGDRWRAWNLLPGWRTRGGKKDIGWAEAIGFYLLIASIIPVLPRGTHFRIHCDNEGVVGGWRNFRSRSACTNNIFKLTLDLLDDCGFTGCAHCFYVPSELNPADGPSRGKFPSKSLLLPPVIIPISLRDFISDLDTTSDSSTSTCFNPEDFAVAQGEHPSRASPEHPDDFGFSTLSRFSASGSIDTSI